MLRILTAILALGLLAIPAQAADYDYGQGGSYVGVPYRTHFHRLPVCDEAKVLSRVTNKFAYYDAHVMGGDLTIAHIGDIRETRVDVNGPSLIPRRYCDATATLSDGRRSEVVYLIEFQAGFASIHWGVQSCLPGYDPYRVYGSWCRSIRP
jgi:hypothetical protein